MNKIRCHLILSILWGFFKAPKIEGTEVVFDPGSFTVKWACALTKYSFCVYLDNVQAPS